MLRVEPVGLGAFDRSSRGDRCARIEPGVRRRTCFWRRQRRQPRSPMRRPRPSLMRPRPSDWCPLAAGGTGVGTMGETARAIGSGRSIRSACLAPEVHAPKRAKALNGSIGTNDVMVMVAVIGARRCGGGAHYRSHAAANRRTDTGTMPAARDCTDYSPGPRPEQTAADCTVGRIVWVCKSGCRQD